MRRTLTAAAILSVLASAAVAQDSQRVPLGTRIYDVFELTPSNTVHVSTLDVPGGGEMVIDVHTPALPVGVEVRTPTGVLLDPAGYSHLTLGAADVPPLGAVLFEEGLHVQLSIPNPAAGAWTVRVTLPPTSPATFGSVTAFLAGGLGVSAVASRTTYFAGDTAVLAVIAFDGTAPVVGATVTANVYHEGAEGSPIVVTLLDDGVEPDAAPGDGLYTAALASLPAGHYLVEGVLQSGARRATAGTDFEVAPRLARFTGGISDQGVDTNGDGLFEHIALNIDVEVDEPGTYTLTGVIRTGGTNALVGGGEAVLAAGPSTVALTFGADAIRKFLDADGPYAITDVVLTRLGDATLGERVADRRASFGDTQPYTLSQLQRPITLIPPGLTAEGIDTDADGLFDLLKVSFEVDTRQFGSYTWTGDLRAPDGTVLGVASGSGILNAGITTVDFSFPGQPIGESGQNGPYLVSNVAVYGPPEAAAIQDELGHTPPFLVTQFEGSVVPVTFGQLIAAVQAVPITNGFPPAPIIRKALLLTVGLAQKAEMLGHPQLAQLFLTGFIHEVQLLAAHHRIAAADAAKLIDMATRLIAQL
jgi:hypothetical protein